MRKYRENKTDEDRKQENEKDDILSRMSRQSGTQSVTSQKTAERVEELERKKQQKEWETTTSEKKSMANVDEQIAKHVADEILRNYPALKHHSNQSIRKLLENEANAQIQQ